jgi:hypothetical protein
MLLSQGPAVPSGADHMTAVIPQYTFGPMIKLLAWVLYVLLSGAGR